MNGIFFLIRNWKVPQRKIEQLTYCHPKLKRRTSASIYRVDGVFTVEHPQQVAIFRNFPLWHHLFNFQWGQQTKVEQLPLLPFWTNGHLQRPPVLEKLFVWHVTIFVSFGGPRPVILDPRINLTRAGMFLLMWFYASFVAPQLANCRYTKSPDSFVKIPKKVVRCRLWNFNFDFTSIFVKHFRAFSLNKIEGNR